VSAKYLYNTKTGTVISCWIMDSPPCAVIFSWWEDCVPHWPG